MIAIELNAERIENARHNAELYGVADKIEFICGDFIALAPKLAELNADAVFVSPPWGGPDYTAHEVFDIETMVPTGSSIYEAARLISPNIAMLLPRNCDAAQLAALAAGEEDARIECEENWLSMDGKKDERLKALTVYYGNLVQDSE